MYRLILESLLGLELEVDKLHVAPCIPADWPGCRGHYRYRGTVYRIVVSQTHRDDDEQPSRMRVTVDGVLQTVQAIPLLDDRQEHAVEVGIDAVPG